MIDKTTDEITPPRIEPVSNNVLSFETSLGNFLRQGIKSLASQKLDRNSFQIPKATAEIDGYAVELELIKSDNTFSLSLTFKNLDKTNSIKYSATIYKINNTDHFFIGNFNLISIHDNGYSYPTSYINEHSSEGLFRKFPINTYSPYYFADRLFQALANFTNTRINYRIKCDVYDDIKITEVVSNGFDQVNLPFVINAKEGIFEKDYF
jgi:hypothetical protein